MVAWVITKLGGFKMLLFICVQLWGEKETTAKLLVFVVFTIFSCVYVWGKYIFVLFYSISKQKFSYISNKHIVI